MLIMKRYLIALLLISGTAFGQSDKMPHVPGEVLILLDDNSSIETVLSANKELNGMPTLLQSVRLVSKPMKIWLLSFDENSFSHDIILNQLYADEHVLLAQNNHYVQERIVPNDTDFGNQWHHIDAQDNDIDSDDAWDITTGGLTANGDTIVVCVLEGGGADWDHPDLIDNHWVNHNEIPNDGLDNDQNGYVDDYDGWNTTGGNDNIAPGSHGTQVSGMIGATGNNNYAVSGINWDVKIMQVDMGPIGSISNPNEANVIDAYTYPLIMRQKYDSSGGTVGAFVVATNASWGIDYGDPASAPMWCALYDTLGDYGILNCGATTNSGLDVDAVGDLPTACGSDYMISVARTGSSDNHAGGYGLTTVDFGAPGISVYTTFNGGGTGSATGTSFASPLTAGLIGLMYSIPCTEFADVADTNGQMAADLVRTALMDGCETVTSMQGKSVTGGRINAYNSLVELMTHFGCATACLTPNLVQTSLVEDTLAVIGWSGSSASYNVRYREVQTGVTGWITLSSATNTDTIFGLTPCTSYEVQVQSQCSGNASDTSTFSTILSFNTTGCGSCIDNIYCPIMSGEAEFEWIESVSIGTVNNVSGMNNGYGDFTGNLSALLIDSSYSITLEQGHIDGPFLEAWRIWVDWNHDGDFADTDELIYNDAANSALMTGSFQVPSSALVGVTRMRVAMKYQSPADFCDNGPSDGYEYGEAEDYCVYVQDSSFLGVSEHDLLFTVYPNPTSDLLTIEFNDSDLKHISLTNAVGQLVQNYASANKMVLDLSAYESGVYFLFITNSKGQRAVRKVIKR